MICQYDLGRVAGLMMEAVAPVSKKVIIGTDFHTCQAGV